MPGGMIFRPKLLGNEYDVIQLKQKPDAKIAIDYGILVCRNNRYERLFNLSNYLHDQLNIRPSVQLPI